MFFLINKVNFNFKEFYNLVKYLLFKKNVWKINEIIIFTKTNKLA